MVNTQTITFTAHAYGGEALGRLTDGRVVFVPFVLPGETAQVHLLEEKSSHARGALSSLLQASSERIEPRCPHFSACGGCHYQHISYEIQQEVKRGILRDQLQRIGGLQNINLQAMTASPCTWNYRNHIQFHLTPQGKLGFKAQHSDEVIAIHECHLPEATLNTLWPQIDLEAVPGLARVSLRLGADEDILLVLEGSDPQAPEFSVDLPLSAVYLGPDGQILLSGNDHIITSILDRQQGHERLFRVSAGSFFQINTPMATAMVEHLLNNLNLKRETTLLEVYCGVGLFSAFLAPHVSRLVGIEASPDACRDFEANLNEFDNVELYEARAETVLPNLELRPDIIIVDPSRAGLERGVIDGILALLPTTLVYVSCDPATLARDARRLTQGGYTLTQITPFDLFPQTYHIESLSFWQLEDGKQKHINFDKNN